MPSCMFEERRGRDIRSSSNPRICLPTPVDGEPQRSIISRAAIAALPITPGAIRRAMFPRGCVPVRLGNRGRRRRRSGRRGLSDRRNAAHLVGSSMGGYAALQFGLRHPEKSQRDFRTPPSDPALILHQRDAWLRGNVRSRTDRPGDRGIEGIAERVARGPARIQLEKQGSEELAGIRCASARTLAARPMSHTMARCQAPCARRSMICATNSPEMATSVLLAVGDEDVACLDTNLMLEIRVAQCPGSGSVPNAGPCHQSGRAGGIQRST